MSISIKFFPRAKNHQYLTGKTKSFLVLSSVVIVLLISFLFLKFFTIQSQAQSQPSFSFTAAGDFGSSSSATAVLNGMNPNVSGASFSLALGDFSYANPTPESAWCDYAKSKFGTNFPFQLVAGNHEDNESPGSSNIDNFAACLPDRIGNLTGRYSREYYFDYPATAPLARMILISPDLTFRDEPKYTYSSGTAHYNWLVSAIDSARTAGIPWVVVSMHKNCITVGNKSCEIGTGLLNLLVTKKVDLILQGHDHNYQRSKQLGLGPNCAGIVANSYNSNCITDNGSDNLYTRGIGSVLTIVGSGGAGLYNVNASDSEAGYFAKWMGGNVNPSRGFLKVNVTADQLTASFEPKVGSFTDNFIIESGLPTATPAPPTETPTLTPSPTIDPFAPTPTDTPTPTITPLPTSTPTPSNTPPVTPTPVTLTLSPLADATVKKDSPTSNYGLATSLEIDGSPIKIVYLKFDLIPLAGKTITSAKLRLRITDSSSSTQTIKSVADNSWQENLVTYNSRPALGSQIATITGGSSGIWKEILLTSAASAKAGQLFSIGIDSTGSDGLDAYSRQNSTLRPELVIISQ